MARRIDPDQVRIGDLTATPMRGRGTREGRRYWRIRRLGTRETVATGWWTRDECEAAVEAARRAPPVSKPELRGVAVTGGDLIRRWADHQSQRRAAGEIAAVTLTQYTIAAQHWLSALDPVLVSRIGRVQVEDTIRGWRAAGVSARSARLLHTVIGMVLRWGADRGLCPVVDLRGSSPTLDREERVNVATTPTRAEATRAIAAVPDPRYRALAELLALTGARVGEGVALQVEHWDRAAAELVISGRDPRRARRGKVRARRFPVVGRLAELLDELAAGRTSGPLVEGLPDSATTVTTHQLAAGCLTSGVARFSAHGLRRLVVLELLDATDARTVAELTGHSVQILLSDYVRPSRDRLRDVVARAHGRRAALRLVSGADD